MERDLERYLVKRVREVGGHAYKFVSPSNRGVTDRLVVLPGGAVWFVEVKTEGGRLAPLQKLFIELMKQLDQNVIVVWSKEDVDAFIAALPRRSR